MNIAPDPKSLPQGTLLSPEANQAAALASATGVLTVDLDALVANWRKLEKTAVPAECAGVVKADAYGTGITEASLPPPTMYSPVGSTSTPCGLLGVGRK